MTHTPLLFSAAILLSSGSLSAQVLGSVYDPQMIELVAEGRIALTQILVSSPANLGLPPDVLAALQSGQLEMRARIELNRGARLLRLWQLIQPPGLPLPAPVSPPLRAPNIGLAIDIGIEKVLWSEFPTAAGTRQTVLIVGRVLANYGSFGPVEGEAATFSFGTDKANSSRVSFVTIDFPGEAVVVVPTVEGRLRIEPQRDRTAEAQP